MKDNDEFTQSVFEKSNRIIAHRRKVRRNIATGLGTLSAIVLIVSALYVSRTPSNQIKDTGDKLEMTIVSEGEEECGSSGSSLTTGEIAAGEIEGEMPKSDIDAYNSEVTDTTSIYICSEKNNYETTIYDIDTINSIVDWLNDKQVDGKTSDIDTFIFTINNDNGRRTIYLPDNDKFFEELMAVIEQ